MGASCSTARGRHIREIADKNGKLLWQAWINHNRGIARELLQNEEHINVNLPCGINGETILIKVCRAGEVEFARLLLEKGANVKVKTKWFYETILTLACQTSGNVEVVQLLLKHGAKISARNYFYQTPLMVASTHNDLELIQLLLAQGAKVNVKDHHGETPLIWSCQGRHNVDVVQLLLEYGAKINAKNEWGHTPLMWSCTNENSQVARLLLERGAKLHEKDKNGKTPLMWSCHNKDPEVARFLLEKGAKLHEKDKNGRTPLMYACQERGNLEVIRLLCELGANIEEKDKDGDTSLMFALCHRYAAKAVLQLLKLGADIPTQEQKLRCLKVACRDNNDELVTKLLAMGVNVNGSDGDSVIITPLMEACRNSDIIIVSKLLKAGADVNVQEVSQYPKYDTALMLACSKGRTEVVGALLKHPDIDLNLKNRDDKTALQQATNPKIKQLIIAKMIEDAYQENLAEFVETNFKEFAKLAAALLTPEQLEDIVTTNEISAATFFDIATQASKAITQDYKVYCPRYHFLLPSGDKSLVNYFSYKKQLKFINSCIDGIGYLVSIKQALKIQVLSFLDKKILFLNNLPKFLWQKHIFPKEVTNEVLKYGFGSFYGDIDSDPDKTQSPDNKIQLLNKFCALLSQDNVDGDNPFATSKFFFENCVLEEEESAGASSSGCHVEEVTVSGEVVENSST